MTLARSNPKTLRRLLRKRKRERGVALVLVLGALTILTIMLTDFQDESSAELGSAISSRDSVRAEYAARSAISLARLLISTEPMIRKALSPILALLSGGSGVPQIPIWDFADQVLGAFNDSEGIAKFAGLTQIPMEKMEKLGMKGAGFDLAIIDEDSKINLNSASRDALTQQRLAAAIMGLIGPLQYEPMFTARDGDGQYSDRIQTCGAIMDWVDSNQDLASCDLTGKGPSSGSEDSFYQLLDPPYFRKNAPLDSLDELHLVRGISDDFWSTFIEPDGGDPKKRTVTVWGQGKINVNTANAQTLLALICGGSMPPAKMCTDPMETAKFLTLVNLVKGLTPGVPLFPSAKAFTNILKGTSKGPIGMLLAGFGLQPVTFASESETQKAIATESKVFTLVATGRVKSGQRNTLVKIRAVVDFRAAPAPASLLVNALAQQTGVPGASASAALGIPGASAAPTASATIGLPYPGAVAGQLPTGLPTGATTDGVIAALMANPAGRIVYFRIE
jgi:general secretion pathway protein K